MASDELKPCPFCGTKPGFVSDGGFNAVISCPKCRQAKVESRWYDGDLGVTEICWNTRAPDATAPLTEALEKARESLDRISRFGRGGSFDPTALAYIAEEALAEINRVLEKKP